MRKILFFSKILSFSVLLGFTNILAVGNKVVPLLVTFKEGQIYKLEIDKGECVPIYEPQYKWKHNLTVSPNDALLALIEYKEGEYYSSESARQGLYDILPKLYLRILNYNGELIHTIEDVQRYVWSPKGDMVAYITYDIKEADYSYRFPTGVWVTDLNKKEEIKIAEKTKRISWARFDNCVYFSDWRDWKKIYKWNPISYEIDTIEYRDFRFSPDGEYYLFIPPVEVRIETNLYKRSTNEDISNILPKALGSLCGWVFNQGHYLLFQKVDEIVETEGEGMIKVIESRKILNVRNSIFDVETKNIVKEFDGEISKWIGNKSRIIVEREGKIVFEEYPK